jgi:hypothetical protein
MSEMSDILRKVREEAAKKILFLPHAIDQMNRPDRLITPTDVREVLNKGQVLEDYPKDSRGHSCLMMGNTSSERTIHLVCSPKEDYLAIITAYLPSTEEWSRDLRTRKKL